MHKVSHYASTVKVIHSTMYYSSEKFIVEYFHVKIVSVKILSFCRVADEKFSTTKILLK